MTDALLARVETALNDWIVTYASDQCGKDKVAEARQRIWENGGTLHYVGTLLHDVREARKTLTTKYGCHCDIEDTIDGKPDACVFDNGDIEDCIYAVKLHRDGKWKTDCEYWRPITGPNAPAPKS